MKKVKIFFSILLLLCFTIDCQNNKNNGNESEAKRMPENELIAKNKVVSYFMKLAETSDMLYLNDSISFYLMDQSPLKVFYNYQDIYDTYHEFVPVEDYMGIGMFILSGPNTSYYAHWLLIDSTLYLNDIKFFEDPSTIFPNNEQYRLMEELTQVKFNKNVSRKYHLPNSILSEEGLMPAIWVSNVFLIKKARKYEENFESWMETPCIELVFQKGKLVSMKVKEDMY
ncbi:MULTISPECIES: hypothetical protein [Proteiniphilum]|jgi:hypothetical protein|uniref:hypothetical protein n=1 Tax=Proteiniphilum TaxID=294702 RepID=UPI001EEC03E2|nr:MULTISPECIES: hypothetical protein [Proteiniphilum]MDD4090002.1 hypothetical protein [Tissierellia bacterium]MDD4438340.1 hypothetical protein [Tissierellia bacterium]ULB34367.1 hypothetical protein KDN43_15660 [Proteiniphilum propionicum]